MRYKHHIKIWQVEGALNAAHVHSLWGWRCKAHGGLDLWTDAGFRTEVIDTLWKAVKDADPAAKVTTMLDTDISKAAYEALGSSGHHVEAAKEWSQYLDILGISIYPNVFEPTPIRSSLIGEVVRELKAAVPRKRIFILETGYPVQLGHPSQSGGYYTEELQTEFVQKAFESSTAAGATGFFYAGIWSDTSLHHHIVGTAWGRWSTGRANPMVYRILAPSIEREDIRVLKEWMQHNDRSLMLEELSEYPIEGFEHFANHFAPLGSAWGLVDETLKALRPSFAALASAFESVQDTADQRKMILNEISKRYS